MAYSAFESQLSEDLWHKDPLICSVKVHIIMKNKNMRNFLLIGLYFVLSLKEVLTQSENEIKRGIYPFMAILYYPDEIVEPTGTRFAHSAVLIKPEWLVSTSLENDGLLEYPRKTLVARVGAIAVDANFTFNEDEDEQEREIIQLVRPTNFSINLWWYNDITLLKTLLPFNVTNAVTWTSLSVKRDYMDKNCFFLVYAKKYNSSDEKVLMQFAVELLPSSIENCGDNFLNGTMICANDFDENKISVIDPDFCLSNSGGPLMCEGGIIGLQTYIGNNCKQPYLYQLLSVWDDFISCGVEEKCQTQECSHICKAIDKDTGYTVRTNEVISSSQPMPTITDINPAAMELSNDNSSDEEHIVLAEKTKEKATETVTESIPTSSTTPKTEMTSVTDISSVSTTENEEKITIVTDSKEPWPKEKSVDYRKKLDEVEDSDKLERAANVEAQLHEIKNKERNAVERSFSGIVGLFYSLSFAILFVIYII